MSKLHVKELFYSLQGEGANTGRAAIFIRLAGCNLACTFCDTDFDDGEPMGLADIAHQIRAYPSSLIIWTGGEPTLQLREEHTSYFRALGYTQAIETNGTHTIPSGIDYIACSPKAEAVDMLHENFKSGVSEWRFLIEADGDLPPDIDTLPPAMHYLLSPVFDEGTSTPNARALDRCLAYVMEHPRWRLSIQLHKLIDIQ